MKRKGVYRNLIGLYVGFSIVSVLLFFIILNVLGVIWSSEAYSNNFPYSITTQQKLEQNIEDIYAINGWVEVLDADKNVTGVYGEKLTDVNAYDSDMLLMLADANQNADLIYRGYLITRTDDHGYFLVMMQRDSYKESHAIKISHTAFADKLNINGFNISIALLLYICICVLMGLFIHFTYGKPLSRINEGIQRIKNGEENVQIHLNGAKEFTDIRDAFNMMSYSLQITRQEKEEQERRKEKMLLNLSHDIRTPIATINSCAQALEDNMISDAEKEAYYHIIKQKAERVSELTEDMLTMLKMGDADYTINPEQKDLCEFLRELCIEYYVEAENAGIEVTANISDTKVIYYADYKLLSRAIGNLLTNAIKYNRNGCQIKVSMERLDEQWISIKVCDDGRAIEKDLVPHLFDAFTRGDVTRKSTEGTGLGLSIADAIIRMHGGSIGYRYVDGWNCFEVLLEKQN